MVLKQKIINQKIPPKVVISYNKYFMSPALYILPTIDDF